MRNDVDEELLKIFLTTNRTMHDAKRAVENGSFAIEATDFDNWNEQECWEFPTLAELKEDPSCARDLELTKYNNVEYVLVILH